ncbi:MAG: sigma-54-dependent Fis family transcriptional regulator [Desulfuromonadaceae bacterium]|nr:sigma-54-dependent Fis family transcriptional regulator [Desulfuromonadaceae bacterium]
MRKYRILLIEDEDDLRKSIAAFFEDLNYEIIEAENGARGIELFGSFQPDIVFTDLRMPVLDGFAVISAIKETSPATPVIVISGTGVMQDAIRAMRLGARDYIVKPVLELEELELVCKRTINELNLHREIASLKEQLLGGTLKNPQAFSGIATQSASMLSVIKYLDAVARSPQPILICGETGTGKEVVAQAIHQASCCQGEFVAVNIAGLDDQVFSDTLFGHVRGAFTGADQARDGLIRKARGGTLFLDEIGDLGPQAQVKLLRLLQEGEYYPMGADYPLKTDARILLATHRNLRELVEKGLFRQDLYYRLSTHQVRLPPLRERIDDIPVLLELFLADAAEALGKTAPTCPPELFCYLKAYSFPGNIRELRAMTFDAVACHGQGMLSMKCFLDAMQMDAAAAVPCQNCDGASVILRDGTEERVPTLKEAEEVLIANALSRAEGNQGVAAGYLGITRNALNKKLIRGRQQAD